MGTPDFAAPTLLELIGQGHDVVAVYTQPPRPAGRGMGERRSPVHDKAEAFGIPVFAPRTLREADAQAQFASLGADAAVVVAYGLILPKAILEAPAEGCLNLHASLLPRWRGAAPIQRAIMAGDTETGVMVMRMAEGLDTGPICMAERVAIAPEDNAGALHDRLATLGADLMVRALGAVERGALTCREQATIGATYAAKIDKAETRIDWTLPAEALVNHIRGLSPAPGAWCDAPLAGGAERIRILRANIASASGAPGTVLSLDPFLVACGEAAIRPSELQRAGKKAVSAQAFLQGARLRPGALLS
jgi:methionyl-tRNA formyltransferase